MAQRIYKLSNGIEVIVGEKPDTDRMKFSLIGKKDSAFFMLTTDRGKLLESVFADLGTKQGRTSGAHRRH